MMMTRLGLTTRLLALLVLGSEAARALQEPHRGASAVLPLEVALPVAPVRLSLGALLNATADNASAPTRGGLGAEPGVLESLQAVAAQAAREVVEVEEEEMEEETYYYNSSAAIAGSNATGAGPARRPLPASSTANFTSPGVPEPLQAVAAQAAREVVEVVEVEEEEMEEETYYYNSSAAIAGSNATGAGPARRPLPASSTANFTSPGVPEPLQAVAAQAAREVVEVVEVEEEEMEEETYYYNSSAAFAGSNATGAGPARRPLPAPSTGNFTYLGCWYDGYPQSRDLGVQHQRSHDDLTPARCVALCSSLGHAFAAVQFSKQCFCSDEPPGAFGKAAEAECDWPCTGDAALACGGRNRNSVYFRGSAEAGL